MYKFCAILGSFLNVLVAFGSLLKCLKIAQKFCAIFWKLLNSGDLPKLGSRRQLWSIVNTKGIQRPNIQSYLHKYQEEANLTHPLLGAPGIPLSFSLRKAGRRSRMRVAVGGSPSGPASLVSLCLHHPLLPACTGNIPRWREPGIKTLQRGRIFGLVLFIRRVTDQEGRPVWQRQSGAGAGKRFLVLFRIIEQDQELVQNS